jgi:hypothetical protein
MTKDQKHYAHIATQVAQEQLQRIANGQYKYAQALHERRHCVDRHICYLLDHLISTLPKEVRAEVQACYNLREQVWSEEYMTSYYAEQEKASPSCLQASDSL